MYINIWWTRVNMVQHDPDQPVLGGPSLSREAGLDYLQRSLPISVILCWCYSMNYLFQKGQCILFHHFQNI